MLTITAILDFITKKVYTLFQIFIHVPNEDSSQKGNINTCQSNLLSIVYRAPKTLRDTYIILE